MSQKGARAVRPEWSRLLWEMIDLDRQFPAEHRALLRYREMLPEFDPTMITADLTSHTGYEIPPSSRHTGSSLFSSAAPEVAGVGMVETIKVSVESASERLFAPFGHLIAKPDAKPSFATKGYSSWRYPLHLTGTPDLTLLHYNHRPVICRGLELHPFLTELRIPLDHKPSLIFVAVADSEPQPSDVRAFLVPGNAAVLIAHHCWHSGFYPLDPCGADYILVSDLETEAELEVACPGNEFRRTRFIDWSERAELVVDNSAVCIQKPAAGSRPQR